MQYQQKEIKIPHLETCEVVRGQELNKELAQNLCNVWRKWTSQRATRTPFGNFTQVGECPTCNGVGQIIADPCTSCGGNGVKQVRKLRINIPAGVDTGTKLRVSGEGNVGLRGGPLEIFMFLSSKE